MPYVALLFEGFKHKRKVLLLQTHTGTGPAFNNFSDACEHMNRHHCVAAICNTYM